MLTDVRARTAKPVEKAYRLVDSGGLHLFVTPAGGKLWRMRYKHAGKEKLLSFGSYPAVTLAEARDARDQAKADLRNGRDPGLVKRQSRLSASHDATNTFEALAREWHALQTPLWTPTHAADVLTSLERDVFPAVGTFPIKELTAPLVLAVLRKIEGRPAIETARRVRQRMSAVFVYAIATGRGENDPAAIVAGAMAPLIKGRQPAVTTLEEAREVLRAGEAVPAHPVTRLALRLLALTAVRPGDLRGARWEEFEDLEGPEPVWRLPEARTKMRREHLVPLSRQSVEVLVAVRTFTGRGPLPFPSTRHAHRPMSENAIGYLLNRAGYHHRHVPHGWRATFSTIMNERHLHERHVIDLMLAHSSNDKVESAYNRAAYLPRRRELAQEWADLLSAELAPAMALVGLVRRSS